MLLFCISWQPDVNELHDESERRCYGVVRAVVRHAGLDMVFELLEPVRIALQSRFARAERVHRVLTRPKSTRFELGAKLPE